MYLNWKSWEAGENYTKKIISGVLINQVTFKASNDSKTPIIFIDKLKNKPSAITADPDGEVYGFGQISLNKDALVEKAVIQFEVDQEWLSEKGAGLENITVAAYDNTSGSWNSVKTEQENQTLSAELSGSVRVFGIVASVSGAPGEPAEIEPEPGEPEVTEEIVPETEETEPALEEEPAESRVIEADVVLGEETSEEEGSGFPVIWILILLVLLLAAAGGGFFYYKKKKEGGQVQAQTQNPPPENPPIQSPPQNPPAQNPPTQNPPEGP